MLILNIKRKLKEEHEGVEENQIGELIDKIYLHFPAEH